MSVTIDWPNLDIVRKWATTTEDSQSTTFECWGLSWIKGDKSFQSWLESTALDNIKLPRHPARCTYGAVYNNGRTTRCLHKYVKEHGPGWFGPVIRKHISSSIVGHLVDKSHSIVNDEVFKIIHKIPHLYVQGFKHKTWFYSCPKLSLSNNSTKYSAFKNNVLSVFNCVGQTLNQIEVQSLIHSRNDGQAPTDIGSNWLLLIALYPIFRIFM